MAKAYIRVEQKDARVLHIQARYGEGRHEVLTVSLAPGKGGAAIHTMGFDLGNDVDKAKHKALKGEIEREGGLAATLIKQGKLGVSYPDLDKAAKAAKAAKAKADEEAKAKAAKASGDGGGK